MGNKSVTRRKNLIIFGLSLFIVLSAVVFFFRFQQYGSDFRYYLVGYGISLVIIAGIILTVILEMRKREDDNS